MAFETSSVGPMSSSKVDADNPPFSRIFIVCGRSTTAEEIRETIAAYGTVEDVWMVKDKVTKENKGICYVKFAKASSAAQAIEYLDGRVIGNDTKPIKVSFLRFGHLPIKLKGFVFSLFCPPHPTS